MLYLRKNFDNAWFSFKLTKEEADKVETVAVSRGIHALLKINEVAKKNNITLSEQEKSAVLMWTATTYESFASDFIEAKVAEEKARSSAPPQTPQ